MAAKRISSSAVNWTEFGKLIPETQKDFYRAFKAKSDIFAQRANALPAELPKVDWARYETAVPVSGMVSKFKQQYEGQQVPYPKDPENLLSKVEQQEKAELQAIQAGIEKLRVRITKAKEVVASYDKLPPWEELQHGELLHAYFPGSIKSQHPDSRHHQSLDITNRAEGPIAKYF